MQSKNLPTALFKGSACFVASYFLSALIQQFLMAVLKLIEVYTPALSMVTGIMLFTSLLLSQEGVLRPNSTAFRILFSCGCFMFGCLSADNIAVLTLQNAFVILLGINIAIERKASNS